MRALWPRRRSARGRPQPAPLTDLDCGSGLGGGKGVRPRHGKVQSFGGNFTKVRGGDNMATVSLTHAETEGGLQAGLNQMRFYRGMLEGPSNGEQ